MEKGKTELMIQLTYECNLNCIHCAYGDIRDFPCPKYGPSIWDFLNRHRTPNLIKISGGEPTLSSSFDRVVRSCKDVCPKVIAFTNGTGNPKENPHAYWVTLFGERKIHNAITRAKTFDTTMEFIKTHEVEFLNTPVFSRAQLKSLREIGRKLDIPLRVTRLIPHGNAVNVLRIERQRHIVETLDLHKKPHWATCSLGFEPPRCWKKACLKPDGREILCTAIVRGLECPYRKKIPALLWNELFRE